MLPLAGIPDVVSRHFCCGCGVCAFISPESIRMTDVPDQGRRPVVTRIAQSGQHGPRGLEDDRSGSDPRDADALAVCPGIRLEHAFNRRDPNLDQGLLDAWGPVYAVWEGYAADPQIRWAGSSGGAATALALFCLEKRQFHGALHTASRPDVPYLNETVLSTTRDQLVERTGSRYAPASPCDGLQQIADAPGRCVFIGKPCDVAAVEAARRRRPELHDKIGLTIACFCAGVPSTQGTLDLLRSVGVDPPRVVSLRYRGRGWPGQWTVQFREGGHATCGGKEQGDAPRLGERRLRYEQSWGFLAKYVQWRCRLCPDHTGELADIAVGDPWYRPVGEREPGRSLVVARTINGLRILRAAAAAGYLVLERQDSSLLPASQPNLLRARGALWGRLLVLRALGIPTPVFRGFPSAGLWWRRLSLKEKLRSLTGTIRRIRSRGLRRPDVAIPRRASANPAYGGTVG